MKLRDWQQMVIMISLGERVLCILFLLAVLWPAASLASDNYEYAPEGGCVSCHQAEYSAWSASDHAWSMKPAVKENVLGDFDSTAFLNKNQRVLFSNRDGRFFVSIEGETGNYEEFRVAYTFGHYPLQQYLIELSRGRLQALTVAWDSRPPEQGGQKWFSLYAGEPLEPGDPLHWTGRSQNWNTMCADCHSTYLKVNYDPKIDSFSTTWAEQSVGCQACHGPGKRHIAWAKSAMVQKEAPPENFGLYVDFGGMSARTYTETCAYCHSRRQPIKDGQHAHEPFLDKAIPAPLSSGLYHPDGQILGEVFVYSSFAQTKMYQAGVTCRDCHNPHTGKVKISGNGLCTQCHNPNPSPLHPTIKPFDYDSSEHHKHPVGSEGSLCVNCHMRSETFMVIDDRRDHSFRIPRPDLTVSTGSPNACNDCHSERSPEWATAAIKDWYPDSDSKHHFGKTLALLRQAQQEGLGRVSELIDDLTVPEIVKATVIDELSKFPDQGNRFLKDALDSGHSLSKIYAASSVRHHSDESFSAFMPQLYNLAVAGDHLAIRDQAVRSLNSRNLNSLTSLQLDKLRAAKSDHRRRLEDLSGSPGIRFQLATELHREGHTTQAADHYAAILKMDPTFVSARLNLANIYSQQGDLQTAERVLVEGLDQNGTPEIEEARIYFTLGLLSIELNDTSRSVEYLNDAVALDPSNIDASYNLGMLLYGRGQLPEAKTVLITALEYEPENYKLMHALTYILARSGEFRAGLKFAERMSASFPDDERAQQMLRYLTSRTDRLSGED